MDKVEGHVALLLTDYLKPFWQIIIEFASCPSFLVYQSVDRQGSWLVFAHLVPGSDPLVDRVRKSFPGDEMSRTFCHVEVSIFQKDSTAADHHRRRTPELQTLQDVHLHRLIRHHVQAEDQSLVTGWLRTVFVENMFSYQVVSLRRDSSHLFWVPDDDVSVWSHSNASCTDTHMALLLEML